MSSDNEDSDVDSFTTLQNDLEMMSEMIHVLDREIREVEEAISDLHRPVEGLHLDQLGAVPFLANSPFRHSEFAVQPPGFPGVDLEKRYSFETICGMLRSYLFSTGAVQPDGTITLNKQLMKLFHTRRETTTFMELLLHLRKVLV
jgi:hypothetical protein